MSLKNIILIKMCKKQCLEYDSVQIKFRNCKTKHCFIDITNLLKIKNYKITTFKESVFSKKKENGAERGTQVTVIFFIF